jgi:hypothetical protein
MRKIFSPCSSCNTFKEGKENEYKGNIILTVFIFTDNFRNIILDI